jgi:predicted outer membrane protein
MSASTLIALALASFLATSWDEELLRELSTASASQTALARVAQERAGNRALAGLASRIVEEHARSADRLTLLARARDVELPGEPDPTTKSELRYLRDLHGLSFDNAWLQVLAHELERRIERVETRLEKTKDPELQKLGERRVEVMRDQLAMTREVARSVGVQLPRKDD